MCVERGRAKVWLCVWRGEGLKFGCVLATFPCSCPMRCNFGCFRHYLQSAIESQREGLFSWSVAAPSEGGQVVLGSELVTVSGPSLVSSPSLQLLSLAVQITLRRPGENYHLIYATVYVTHANKSQKVF